MQLTSINALESSLTDLIRLKPQWTPEALYNWSIAPPPSSTMTTNALKNNLENLDTAEVPMEQVEEVGGQEQDEGDREVKKQKMEQNGEGEERRPDEFNPLLFRALQGLGRKLQAEQA